MKKKTLSIALALTVAMGIALTGCGKDAGTESTDKSEDVAVTTTTDEKSSETEQESTGDTNKTDESTETETEEDYTYCNLLSDPYFDMDNAIKDENGTAAIQDGSILKTDKEILYNIVDGDRYVEISGAESYDVNNTITMYDYIGLFPNLAYYGVEPNPNLSMVPETRFSCIDTTYFNRYNISDMLMDIGEYEITVTKAYTIPTDSESNNYYCYVATSELRDGGETPALCEVEYNGTHYWTTGISLEKALGELE